MSERIKMDVAGPCLFRGHVTIPGDKSTSLRALLLAAQASGGSRLMNTSTGFDTTAMVFALRQLGAVITEVEGGLRVAGGGLAPSKKAIDLGASATSARLLLGTLAGSSFSSRMAVTEPLHSIDLRPLIGALRGMGADIEAHGHGGRLPVTVNPSAIRAGTYRSPVVSAQVKSAMLLAALSARADVVVQEPVPTRRHTEELLAAFGANVSSMDNRTTRLCRSVLLGCQITIPGDPSHAAYWLVAAACHPEGDVTVRNTYLDRRRAGYLDVLARMGASVSCDDETASARVRHDDRLRATTIETEEIPGLLDEIPALAVAAATADGTTVFRGVSRVRATGNRLAETAEMLRQFGVPVHSTADSLAVTGLETVRPAVVDVDGDHHLAMSAVILASGSVGVSRLTLPVDALDAYPEFIDHLSLLTSGLAGPHG